jgi:trehalose-6-phosphate synthase
MRFSLRFIIPLTLVLGTIALLVVPLVDGLTLKWATRDLDIRSQLITNTLHDSLVPLVKERAGKKILLIFNRAIQDERLFALAFCDPAGKLLYHTLNIPEKIQSELTVHLSNNGSWTLQQPSGSLHIRMSSIEDEGAAVGYLVLVHDMSFIERRSAETKKFIYLFFGGLITIVSFLTVFIVQLSWKGWIAGVRALLRGEGLVRPLAQSASPEIQPIMKDLHALIRDLEADRRLRDESQISWSPHALKEILHRELAGDEILIVSNREPYIHNRKEGQIEVQVPASGLVTALEPIMRACSGTWIAHGSGTADKEVVDRYDHVQVPPEEPAYRIRRIWLNSDEEAGYYYGFSNEGLWPLCHIAHTRPVFRSEDWKHYTEVNQKFARAVMYEAKTEDPVILVQDYHFALLPRILREKIPGATILTFWHIPWPNSESFGICPWREELLDGLLGSSILGFHTRYHCNNFLDTMDRFTECRIDHDASLVSYGGEITAVNPYPISIEWPVRWNKGLPTVAECREKIHQTLELPKMCFLGIGVDRMDYTKGILERFLAVERLLELYPHWIGQFTFIQIAAPSRSTIEQYQHFENDVRNLVRKINHRFAREGYQPIVLKVEHHDPARVFEYYRGADLCFVSSLHDGMNLVAKEFVAAREDEQGVLLLSQFTGAARELPEALIINPYNIDQCATALHRALEMPPREQRERMSCMRGLVQEFNIYRWAGRMLMDAARLRQRSRFMGRFHSAEKTVQVITPS